MLEPRGVAAALAVSEGVAVPDVEAEALQGELRRQGVYLTAAMAGGPPRGPKVSITADTPAL